ncbi:MAG TPA: AAA family ATPase, partial [Pseudomonadota bacterium]|nr:AAA family ATPase [Pseudomonadota bacterium]
MPSAEQPRPRQLARLRHEHQLLQALQVPGVIRCHGIVSTLSRLVLVLEDIGGSSLRSQISGPLPLHRFLKLAIEVTTALAALHEGGIIHKDINPSNIVWNQTTGQVQLIDFGIASQLPRETQAVKNPNLLEGTLAYLSPEQTGRMNRSIDYRSDFYALGMTFYELLTGQTAFRAGDAMELVHCHIARTPQPPSLLNPMVPEVLSSMVMKLVSKMAEERYQSALGLLHDLKECQQQLQQNNGVEAFPIATRDVSHQLRLPQKLYGRAGDIERLRQEFARASAGQQQLLLISGYPGVGKSALVQEVHKGIAEGGGLMIAGKFDLLSRSVPYSAVLHAFRDLMRQLLSEPEEHLSKWRLQIQSAVGRNGQVLVELIPELEQIIGPQPAVPELGATESQNRFGLVFQNFLRVFSRPGQTLVVFLDDLQWADLASLRLLE